MTLYAVALHHHPHGGADGPPGALKVSDRAFVLEHGRIVHEGTSADLLDDPRVLGAYPGSR